MPRTLLAQTETPLPQIATPRSTFPLATALSQRDNEVGIIVARIQTVSSEIDHFVPGRAQLFLKFLLHPNPP